MRVASNILSSVLVLSLAFACVTWGRTNGISDCGLAVGSSALAVALFAAAVGIRGHRRRSGTAVNNMTRRAAIGAIFGIYLFSTWLSAISLKDALVLCNQEYLHWIPTNSVISSPSASVRSMIIESFLTGVLSGTFAGLLFLLMFHNRSPEGGLGNVEDTVAAIETSWAAPDSISNPYRSPQSAS